MIKTGIRLSSEITPQLVRLLINHPDIDIRWIATNCDLNEYFSELCGELPNGISTTADFDTIDLYIGDYFDGLSALLLQKETLRAVITSTPVEIDGGELGVAEYNRKALVRGCRVAIQPDVVTLLSALALMPLAKNLLLNSPIATTMLLPMPEKGLKLGNGMIPSEDFEQLNSKVLTQLQASFSAPISAATVGNGYSTFAGAEFKVECKMELEDIQKLYHEFYDDHRHIVITDGAITQAMVRGTNKTVISLDHDGSNYLNVSIAFDAIFKAGAGNIVHLLNLLFGLHECTGL